MKNDSSPDDPFDPFARRELELELELELEKLSFRRQEKPYKITFNQ